MPPYYRWISWFSDIESHTLLLVVLYYTMDLNHHYTVQQTVALPIKLVYDWKTRYAFEHFYLLSRTHSSPPCSPCYQLAFNTYSYLSI